MAEHVSVLDERVVVLHARLLREAVEVAVRTVRLLVTQSGEVDPHELVVGRLKTVIAASEDVLCLLGHGRGVELGELSSNIRYVCELR